MPRLARIRGDIFEALTKHRPGIVAIEGYSYASKGSSSISLGELGGIIRWELWTHHWLYVEIPPSCRARYATGRGNAAKDLVLQHACTRAGRVFEDNNQADAWWLWQMALAHYAPDDALCVTMPITHRQGLAGVDWPTLPTPDRREGK
jgi:Holliday junction resolvasome RuvABC endonuclease subunit